MADNKNNVDLTVEAGVEARDAATQLVPPPPPAEFNPVEGTAAQHYGERLPDEVKQSGIGVGFVSGTSVRGASLGVQDEEDHRAQSPQSVSQEKPSDFPRTSPQEAGTQAEAVKAESEAQLKAFEEQVKLSEESK